MIRLKLPISQIATPILWRLKPRRLFTKKRDLEVPENPGAAPRALVCTGKDSSLEDGKCRQPSETRNDRKLNTLRKYGLFGDNTNGATIKRAGTFEELRDAYRLVHEIYIGTGYIVPHPSGIRLRMHEARPDTATFIAKVGARVVGVLSIVPDSTELGLPSDTAFKSELDLMRRAHARLCEATNQVVDPRYRRSAVSTELMRCAVAHMTRAGFDEVIATVSPSHNGFYELLRFREVGSERSYSEKLHDPVVALSMDVNQYRSPAGCSDGAWHFVHHFMAEGNSFLRRVEDWDHRARTAFMNSSLLRQLFVRETGFLDLCTPAEERIVKHLWGRKVFAKVHEASLVSQIQERATALLCWLDTMDFTTGLPAPRSLTAL